MYLQSMDKVVWISWEKQGNASKYYCATVHTVNLSDPHSMRSPAIENEKAGDFARRLFWA